MSSRPRFRQFIVCRSDTGCGAASQSFIYFAAVRDPRHINGSGRVVNDVNDPVVTHTNPSLVIAAFEFFAARRAGSRHKTVEALDNAGNHFLGEET